MYVLTATVLFRFYIKPRIQDREKFIEKKWNLKNYNKIYYYYYYNRIVIIVIIMLFEIDVWIYITLEIDIIMLCKL